MSEEKKEEQKIEEKPKESKKDEQVKKKLEKAQLNLDEFCDNNKASDTAKAGFKTWYLRIEKGGSALARQESKKWEKLYNKFLNREVK